MIHCQFEKATVPDASLRHVTVVAIVTNEKNEILLVKRAHHLSRGGKYTVPGGFLDRDETTEEGALRELQEETGYTGKIKCLLRVNDNPNRPNEDRQNVDFIFVVEVTGGEKTLNNEVTEITWFTKENLPAENDFAFDHRESILLYFQYRKSPFVLPKLG